MSGYSCNQHHPMSIDSHFGSEIAGKIIKFTLIAVSK